MFPSTKQLSGTLKSTVNVRVMEVLSADFLTVGLQHFLIYAEKISSILLAHLFLHMTTANSVDMLKDIIRIHGRPKMIVIDSGPSFGNKYVAQLRALNVDHSYSKAYMPSRNGCAERVVGLVKRMIELNTPNGNSQLQDLVQATNM